MLKLALFLLLAAASVASGLLLLPWLKEGFDVEELPLFSAVAGGLIVLALAWWAACREARGGLFVVGLTLLGLPLLVYLMLIARLVRNEVRGRQLARTVRVTRLSEEPIRWPGFDGAVGLRLEIELEHRLPRAGNLFPPRILMGKSPPPSRKAYFSTTFSAFERAFLERPVFQAVGREEEGVNPGEPAQLAYELYPAIVRRLRPPDEVCLADFAVSDEGGSRLSLLYSDGTDLGASWFFAGRGGLYVDLSGALTEALRQVSTLEGRPWEWKAMLRRIEPSGLEAAGFRPCGGQSGEKCYCRTGGEVR